MLRARLLTSLVFNLVLAAWVLHDARRRRARKPVFAAVLTLLWGPLGLGFWESDRPLRAGERRFGAARAFAGGFLRGWVAMLPAIAVLAWDAMAHRAAVPGSLPRDAGLPSATIAILAVAWGGPALLAMLLARLGRTSAETSTPAASASPVSTSVAAAVAGAGALVAALAMR